MALLRDSSVCFRITLGLLILCNLFVPTNASTAKFQSWFPLLSRRTFGEISSQTCNETLMAYQSSLGGNDTVSPAAACSSQLNCVLRNLREDIQSRMSSASVLLGLTPGLLASIGPSVAEIAVLATQAPLLSFLISLGCPAVYPSRPLEYEDAREILRKPAFQPISNIHNRNPTLGVLVQIMKYLCLFVAVANVFYTSWDLGIKTVVSWRCINYTLPLAWSTLSVVIHVFASAAFYTQPRHFWSSMNQPSDYENASRGYSSTSLRSGYSNVGLRHGNSDLDKCLRPTGRSIVLQYIASFIGFIHVVFGIMVFSSLLFIDTVDVVAVILRYMASVLTSRTILMFELDHIRRQQNGQHSSNEQPQEDERQLVPMARIPSDGYGIIARKPVPAAQVNERHAML